MKGVEHLSNLKKLRKLVVDFGRCSEDYDKPIWAHAAGRIPNLQHFNFKGKPCSKFVDLYGKLYPGKKLHLHTLE